MHTRSLRGKAKSMEGGVMHTRIGYRPRKWFFSAGEVAVGLCAILALAGCGTGTQSDSNGVSSQRLPGFAPTVSTGAEPSQSNENLAASQPGLSNLIVPAVDVGSMSDSQSQPSNTTRRLNDEMEASDGRQAGSNQPEPEPETTEESNAGVQSGSECATDCGSHAQCTNGECMCDDGYQMVEQRCEPVDPCVSVSCGATERCVAGECVCRDGFVEADNGQCQAAPMSPLESRTADEVCERWNAFTEPQVSWIPTPGVDDPCDPGQVPADAQDAAVARVNLYRWLVGLPSVGLVESILSAQQECAVLMNAINQLTHHPSPDLTCYTPGAAQGAGSSNLALGASLTQSVDLFVADRGVPSLGHRRWVFNPGMQATAFGHKGRGTCMYSFSMGGDARPDFIAWPPPGTVPVAAADGMGSLTLHSLRPGPEFRIEATLDGETVELELNRPVGNYGGGRTYSYTLPRGTGRDGTSVTLSMRGLRDTEDITWTTTWVRCN